MVYGKDVAQHIHLSHIHPLTLIEIYHIRKSQSKPLYTHTYGTPYHHTHITCGIPAP